MSYSSNQETRDNRIGINNDKSLTCIPLNTQCDSSSLGEVEKNCTVPKSTRDSNDTNTSLQKDEPSSEACATTGNGNHYNTNEKIVWPNPFTRNGRYVNIEAVNWSNLRYRNRWGCLFLGIFVGLVFVGIAVAVVGVAILTGLQKDFKYLCQQSSVYRFQGAHVSDFSHSQLKKWTLFTGSVIFQTNRTTPCLNEKKQTKRKQLYNQPSFTSKIEQAFRNSMIGSNFVAFSLGNIGCENGTTIVADYVTIWQSASDGTSISFINVTSVLLNITVTDESPLFKKVVFSNMFNIKFPI
ncbi:uncharacterized protein LOC111086019 isoform X2 [Limulus polyphemus]|uniref:Uncharacterized protein LOC111086019 isoform X2 n=1 Tax=Limulus polyphemus TaxID=6850 RepID=A0ABM1SH74_LIMPO|nr:uncharacterized protein LOC111086019 isoform X2 [Limulus polyphemus]